MLRLVDGPLGVLLGLRDRERSVARTILYLVFSRSRMKTKTLRTLLHPGPFERIFRFFLIASCFFCFVFHVFFYVLKCFFMSLFMLLNLFFIYFIVSIFFIILLLFLIFLIHFK